MLAHLATRQAQKVPEVELPLDTDSLSRGARHCGLRAAASVEPAKQVQLRKLELASEVQVQVYLQVDPNHFEFQRAITNIEVEV